MIKKIKWTDEQKALANSGKLHYDLHYNFYWGCGEKTCADYIPCATLQDAVDAYIAMRDLTDWDGSPAYRVDEFYIMRHNEDMYSNRVYDSEDLDKLYKLHGADVEDIDLDIWCNEKNRDRYVDVMWDGDAAIKANKEKYDRMADEYIEYDRQRERDAQAADEYYADLTRRGYQFVMA